MDGTLLDTNCLHVIVGWEAFRERGLGVRPADIHQVIGRDSAALVEQALDRPDAPVIAAHRRHMAPYLGRMRALPGPLTC